MEDLNGDGKLLIKLKKTNGDDTRICQVCNKVFGSGKALGGHMRIHYQAHKYLIKPKECNKFKLVKNKDVTQKPPTCVLCGKNFLSKKSLFGHMRCHPERDWRGIEPPSSMANKSFSSQPENGIHRINSAGSDKDSVGDLVKAFPNWSVTAKRGRKIAIPDTTSSVVLSSEDEEIHEVAHHLMLLQTSHGNTFEGTNSNSLTNKVELEDSNPIIGLKRQEIEESPDAFSDNDQNFEQEQLFINGNCKGRSIVEISDDQPHGGKGSIVKNKIKIKKRKKMKLMDLENVQDDASPIIMGDKYKCSTCDKCLPTYQALGGHRSSHNKFKLVIQNNIDESSSENGVKVEEKKESEETVVVGEGSTHQCDICFKFFVSSQAFGEHKRCHWSGTMEAQSSQIMSPGEGSFTSGRGLDIDLNVALPVEDELADVDSYLIS